MLVHGRYYWQWDGDDDCDYTERKREGETYFIYNIYRERGDIEIKKERERKGMYVLRTEREGVCMY